MAGVAGFGLRSYMSTWMLRSASRSATCAAKIENEHRGEWAAPHIDEHVDHVTSAVLGTATFLEAMVNELFTDAHDRHGLERDGYLAPLPAEAVRLMSAWWEETDQGYDRTLTKYQLLLSFADKDKMDRGAEPYQSASLLLGLRNAVAHYRPSTVYADEPHQLEGRFTGRFQTNDLIPPGVARGWPNGILGAGCATWACGSALALADEVCARLGIVPNYQRILFGKPAPQIVD